MSKPKEPGGGCWERGTVDKQILYFLPLSCWVYMELGCLPVSTSPEIIVDTYIAILEFP